MMGRRTQTKKNANGEGGIWRRPDGRWEAKLFVDTPAGQRKRISVYASSEREALNELNRLRDQQRRGIPHSYNDIDGGRLHGVLAGTHRRAWDSADDVRHL
jgi:hypothetical protein